MNYTAHIRTESIITYLGIRLRSKKIHFSQTVDQFLIV